MAGGGGAAAERRRRGAGPVEDGGELLDVGEAERRPSRSLLQAFVTSGSRGLPSAPLNSPAPTLDTPGPDPDPDPGLSSTQEPHFPF